MLNAIKNLIPQDLKENPSGIYNRLRRILGVSKTRYNVLKKVIENNPEIEKLFPANRVRQHYAHETMRQSIDFPALYVNQIRYYRMYKFFQSNYPEIFNDKIKIIDVGDTSGMLFLAMKKSGLAANINQTVVDHIKASGIEAEVQNAESLTCKDKSFDYAFCFQCLEHLKNPLRCLDELGRIAKKIVFLSIPYTKKSRVCNKDIAVNIKTMPIEQGGYGAKNVLDSDCHVFEFSTKDFKKLLNFTRLEYVDNFPINYTMPLGETKKNKGSFFNLFILKPKQ